MENETGKTDFLSEISKPSDGISTELDVSLEEFGVMRKMFGELAAIHAVRRCNELLRAKLRNLRLGPTQTLDYYERIVRIMRRRGGA
jgi:hypothetical protein